MSEKTTLHIGAEDHASEAIKHVGESVKALSELMGANELIKVLKENVDEYAKAEQGQVRLENAFKNTGSIIGITRGDLDIMAKSIMDTSTADDEMVVSAEQILLSFTNLNSKTFPETLKSASELAAKMGTDLPAAAQLLGKALEDPEKGARLLRQANIILTQSEIDQIKALEKSGQMEAAQEIILNKVNVSAKNMAETMRGTFTGSVELLNNQMGELQKAIGKVIADAILPLIQHITQVIKWIVDMNEATHGWVASTIALVGAAAAVVLGIQGVISVWKILNVVMRDNPIGLIAFAITAILIPAIAYLITNFDTLQLMSQRGFTIMGHAIETFVNNAKILLMEFAAIAIKSFEFLFQNVIGAINKIIEAMNQTFHTNLPTITALFNGVTDAIQKTIDKTKAEQQALDTRYKAEIKSIDDKIAALKKEKKSTEDAEKEKADIVKTYTAKQVEIVKQGEAQKQEAITNTREMNMQDAQTLSSSLQSISNQYYSNEIANAGDNAEKKKQLQRDQFNINKALAVANSIINTAEAVTKNLDIPPVAVAVGIMGAIETALIAAQPMPAFQAGTMSAPGGYALVGENGPEIVKLNQGAQVRNNRESGAIGGDTHIHIGNVVANDPIEFYRKMSIQTKRRETARGLA